jgi:AmmeMemoRadiSam system protein B/AmmeMemoRadiSam system protein A
MPTGTRPAAVAGRFYPARAELLAAEIARCLDAVRSPGADAPAPKIVIAPHAGTIYSGPIAAHAYARLAAARDRIRRVVLLGPSHRVALRGLALPTVAAFATPLGTVPIDAAAAASLAALPQVVANDAAHRDEHALEVQLPFLQTVLGAFTLVPLVVGRATRDEVAELLEALWGGDETLVVISSDLSHYLPYAQARDKDRATAQRIVDGDAALDHDQACGATPINGALLAAARHGLAARQLDLRNSGDTAGDRDRVVGYGAFEFVAADDDDRTDDDDREATTPADDAALGPALRARAHNAIARPLLLATLDEPVHPQLARPGASFVTLRHRGRLRGCIGSVRADRSLDDDVRANAAAAAFDDPRFERLDAAEFDAVEIEVSLLGATTRLPSRSQRAALAAVRPRLDGLVLRWRGCSATLLPQVWAQLPDAAGFLAALKHKAGLSDSFWAPDVELSRFRIRSFGPWSTT